MSEPQAPILRLAPQRADYSFEEWLTRLKNYAAKILSLGVVSTLLSTIYGAITRNAGTWFVGDPQRRGWIIPIIDATQFLIIFIVLLIPVKGPNTIHDEETPAGNLEPSFLGKGASRKTLMEACGYQNDPQGWAKAKEIAENVYNQYLNLWRFLWLSWLLLYLILAIKSIPNLYEDPNRPGLLMYVLDVTSTFLNNCAALIILFCYFILAKPTVSESRRDISKQQVEWIRWITIAIVFTIVEAVFLGITLKFPDALHVDYKLVVKVFGWTSGISSATIMALYAGRLDSKFLDSPTWLLVMLFSYASIQPLFAVLGDNLWGSLILVNAALFFKCIWFLYMAWLFETGRLLFYFVRIRRLYQQVNTDWKDFSSVLRRVG
jgi:hypothetical protein